MRVSWKKEKCLDDKLRRKPTKDHQERTITDNIFILTEIRDVHREPISQCPHVAGCISEPSMPVICEDLHVYLAEGFLKNDKFTLTTDTACTGRMQNHCIYFLCMWEEGAVFLFLLFSVHIQYSFIVMLCKFLSYYTVVTYQAAFHCTGTYSVLQIQICCVTSINTSTSKPAKSCQTILTFT